MGAIYKDGISVEITGFSNLAENPVENLVYSLRGKTMLEIITDCGEMWCFFLQTVAQKASYDSSTGNSYHSLHFCNLLCVRLVPFEGIIANGRGVVVKIMEDGKKGTK